LGGGQFGWGQLLLRQLVWVAGGDPLSIGAFDVVKAVASGNAENLACLLVGGRFCRAAGASNPYFTGITFKDVIAYRDRQAEMINGVFAPVAPRFAGLPQNLSAMTQANGGFQRRARRYCGRQAVPEPPV